MKTAIAVLTVLAALSAGAIPSRAARPEPPPETGVRYLANGGTLDITGKTVKASDIRDLKVVMPIPQDIRAKIASRGLRNVIFEVRIYDRAERLQTLEGRVDYEKNLRALSGKPSLTLWLIKPGGGSDFAFRIDGVSERTTDVNPIEYQRDRMSNLVAEGITTFKVKVRIMPYWVVQTITGPQEKGAPFYYPNETVPQVSVE